MLQELRILKGGIKITDKNVLSQPLFQLHLVQYSVMLYCFHELCVRPDWCSVLKLNRTQEHSLRVAPIAEVIIP